MKTILLIEDESVVMKILRITLNQYNLLEAMTAEDALRLFIERGPQLDLLFTDVTLPTSSGTQVALLLRAEIPNLPIILSSGYPANCWSDPDCADLERLDSHSVTILQKPFTPEALSTTVCNLIGAPRLKR